MYSVKTEHYIDLSERLREAIDGKCFFSGSIYIETEDADCQFLATLIITYKTVRYPEGDCPEISGISQVWWEYHTTTLDGEQINDFNFETLKNHLLVCQ